jgi:hypothetical protein
VGIGRCTGLQQEGEKEMVTQEFIKKYGIKFPVKGAVFVRLLKHNKAVNCTVLSVGKRNSTIQVKGVETKVPNEDVDIDYPDDED